MFDIDVHSAAARQALGDSKNNNLFVNNELICPYLFSSTCYHSLLKPFGQLQAQIQYLRNINRWNSDDFYTVLVT